jgi:hypothetical protein
MMVSLPEHALFLGHNHYDIVVIQVTYSSTYPPHFNIPTANDIPPHARAI